MKAAIRHIIVIGLLLLYSHNSYGQEIYEFIGGGVFNTSDITLNKVQKGFSLTLNLDESTVSFKDSAGGLIIRGDIKKAREDNHHLEDFKPGIAYHFMENIRMLNGYGIFCDSIAIGGDSLYTALDSCKISTLQFYSTLMGGNLKDIDIRRSVIKKLIFEDVSLTTVYFGNESFIGIKKLDCSVDSLKLINCTILKPLEFPDIARPSYIFIDGIDFINTNSVLDLTKFDKHKQNRICRIMFNNSGDDFSKIKLNYENFQLVFDGQTNAEKERLYKALLENQSKLGYTYGYEKLDKEFKHFKYTENNTLLGILQDDLDRRWWDYGYNKFKVITNSIRIFLMVLLLNIILYPQLIQLYLPEKLKKWEERLVDKFGNLSTHSSKVKFYLYRIPGIAVYTAYLFWGLKLDIKEIEIKKPIIFITLICEYVLGIICLAYIANYVISK